jgi:Polysaccharide lyase 14
MTIHLSTNVPRLPADIQVGDKMITVTKAGNTPIRLKVIVSGPPQPPVPLTARSFGPDFATSGFAEFAHQMASAGSDGVITVAYPKGSTAPSMGEPYGGAQIAVPFASGPAKEVVLEYNLRIPQDFDFVKGGKLPGVYGGIEPFSGGGHNPDGWSMRLMWRASGKGEIYGYVSDSPEYGDSWNVPGFKFLADWRWHHVTLHVGINNPGKSDGFAALLYDGVTVVAKSGLSVTTKDVPVTGLFFSTFYGGHTPDWAPPSDMHLDMSGFKATAVMRTDPA